MYRSGAILVLTLTLVPLSGCGVPSTPPATPPSEIPAPVQRIEANRPPRLIQKQITVMGKNGPEIVTITETEKGGTEKIRTMPFDPSPREVLKTRPKEKQQ